MSGFQSGGQTDYSQFPAVGFPGMRYRASSSDEVLDYVASGTIVPGQLVEVVAGTVRAAQSTSGSIKPVIGVVLYKATYAPLPGQAAPPNSFVAGDRVAVLRKGRVFAAWSGTTQGEMVTANYYHPSTGSTASTIQGYITDAATSATAGVECDVLPQGCRIVRSTTQSGFASGAVLMELNLPAD